MRNSVNFQRLLVTDGQIQCRLMPFLIDSYLNAQQSPYPRERKGRCNPNLRKDPIPSAVLFLFEGKKPLLLADPAPGQGNNDQAQGERPSDLYGTDGTASLTVCAASIDTSESWVGSLPGKINLESCLERYLFSNRKGLLRGNHALEVRITLTNVEISLLMATAFCQIDTPHASPLSFNSFDRSYKLGKGDVVGGGGLFQ
uniref:Uncharacterized protein n=1 Tax=Salix viminalis TaxID=40686 RepID=A0A6N2KP02_SALVM